MENFKLKRMENNNIFYGGPLPENITDGTRSLGEFCYKRLKQFEHQVLIVQKKKTE